MAEGSLGALRRKVLAARLQKLELEVRRMQEPRKLTKGSWLRALPMLLAAAGFVFGIVKYERARVDEVAKAEDERTKLLRKEEMTRDLDARHALWDRQLELYFRASQAAATIATTPLADDLRRKNATDEFWNLYWGPLAIVEDKALLHSDDNAVETAMVAFGTLLGDPKTTQAQLQMSSLSLAHEIEKSISKIWSVTEVPKKGVAKTAEADRIASHKP